MSLSPKNQSAKRKIRRPYKTGYLLVVFCFMAILLLSCSSSDKKENEKTFNLTINFAQFRTNVQVPHAPLPVRIDVSYYKETGSFEYLSTDTILNEETFKIPHSAIYFSIIARALNVDYGDPNYEDWAALSYQFVFNNNYSIASVDNLIPFCVVDDFGRFTEVKAVVIDKNERIDLFFNGEAVDLDARVMPLGKAAELGPLNVPDTHNASAATELSSIMKSLGHLQYMGMRYKFNVDYYIGNEAFNHFQGMGWWRDRYVILTHSSQSWDGIDPRLYLVDTRTNNSRSVIAAYGNTKLFHPGGGQVIEDYFVFAGVGENNANGIFVQPLNSFTNGTIYRLYQRGVGDEMRNSAIGVTKVRADYKYGSGDVVGPANMYKYIFALVDYDYYEVLLYRSEPVSSFSAIQNLSYFNFYHYLNAGKFNNISLFTEYDGSILMMGFDSESYNTKAKPDEVTIKTYKILEDPLNNHEFTVADQKTYINYRILSIDQVGSEDINGRWGATSYFDGRGMHIFMTNRRADVPRQREISYNHWYQYYD